MPADLTDLERQALTVLAEGRPHMAAARRFTELTGLSDRTYRRVLLRAEHKLGARSRMHAAVIAAAHGLIAIEETIDA